MVSLFFLLSLISLFSLLSLSPTLFRESAVAATTTKGGRPQFSNKPYGSFISLISFIF